MVNSVILSVYIEILNLTMDMELPCYLPIRLLEEQILNELKARYSHPMAGIKSIRLWFNDRAIDPRISLADEEIWDGQYLTVKVGE